MSKEQTNEERKNPLMYAGVSADLQPGAVQAVRIALSNRQNYAMAAEEIFCHALNRTVWVYRQNYEAVDLFMNTIRNTAMESIATENGLATVCDMVFKDNHGAMREFLFTLKVQFFSQFSEFNDPWIELVKDLAKSLTNDSDADATEPELNLVPEELRIRTFTTERMTKLLMANSWLVMFLFVALWGRTLTYDELRAKYRRGSALTASS